jgi:hypothetical protein
MTVVERLDTQSVSRQQKAPLGRVPDREGEHAPQPRNDLIAEILVEVDETFGVR